jgi:phosphomannomutase
VIFSLVLLQNYFQYPQKLADGQINVESVRDLTTGYDNAQVDGKAVLPSDPSCQMITFNFDNGVIATLRTSGTEPKLKYYAEYCGKPEQTDWSSIETELDKLVHHLTEEFLQPKLNGLLPRTA